MRPNRRALDFFLLASAFAALAVVAACAGNSPINVEGDDDDDGAPVTFAQAFSALEQENCGSSGCHLSPAATAGNLILPNLAGAVTMTNAYMFLLTGGNGGPAVTPGNGEDSLLMRKGLGEAHTGGQQWSESDDTYETIEDWIDDGAPYP